MTMRTPGTPFSYLRLGLVAVLVLPLLEFVAFSWVAQRIGFIPALFALVATSFIGLSLLRRQGVKAASRLAGALRRDGTLPEGATREGLMVALGGILMILPGFITDAIGFVLIAPSLARSILSPPPAAPRPSQRPPRADPRGRVVDLDPQEWRAMDDQAARG
jgi:UPF0716 protein FxsA